MEAGEKFIELLRKMGGKGDRVLQWLDDAVEDVGNALNAHIQENGGKAKASVAFKLDFQQEGEFVNVTAQPPNVKTPPSPPIKTMVYNDGGEFSGKPGRQEELPFDASAEAKTKATGSNVTPIEKAAQRKAKEA